VETVPGMLDMLRPPMLLKFNEPSELKELKVTDPPGCAKYDGFRSTIPPPELFELELEFVHCILIPRTNNGLLSCVHLRK
jgi:hypothetical protein